MKLATAIGAAVMAFCLTMPAHARYTHGQDMSAPAMRTFGHANAPMGYLEFCRTFTSECTTTGQRQVAINLTPERLDELNEVNDHVNRIVRPVTDEEFYQVTEKWIYPDAGYGDCEDYVLLKRRILIERGWPASALLITVVRDEKGDGHAVLTVVTNRGDLILDNQRKSIRPWNDTGYYYIKRQSPLHPASWLSLRDVRYAHSNSSTSGAR